MKSSILKQTLAIIKKDLRRELRSREITITTVSFSVLLMVVFTFSFYQDDESVRQIFPGILWVSIVFAGTLAIARTFADERDSGCLRALALIPGTNMSLYLGKLVTNLFFMAVFELALVPLLVIAFDIDLAGQYATLSLILAGGTLGFAALGTLLSAMLVHHKLREVLVPLLLYPLLVPLIIGGVKATSALLEPTPDPSMQGWLRLIWAMDAIFLVAGQALFGKVLEAIE